LRIDGIEVGSVARAHLAYLAPHADLVTVADDGVTWLPGRGRRDAAFAGLHHALRAQGLIRAWRDETYAVVDPATLRVLACIERAASRFWGTLTFGAHANGFVRDAAGRPGHLWIAQRSPRKATDPGRFDNLVGGGVPHGQTPAQALVREAWEEAGLRPHELLHARPGGVLALQRAVPEGWQHEWLYSYDVELPAGRVPHNQDGEVAGFTLMPVSDALALACDRVPGAEMTADAALVTLDFALRHGLLHDAALTARVQAHRVVRPA
jgi:8-oxo-dGTP pyrophosphatase MutT (NUDIX family)